MRSTEEVLNHHSEAFEAGDVTAVMEDYTEESFIIAPDGSVYEGSSQIRPAFEAMFAEFAKPGASLARGLTVIKGEIAFITWSAETADKVYEEFRY